MAADLLERIVAAKEGEVAERRRERPVPALRKRPLYGEPRRGFARALAAHRGRAIIAELKRASPSRGVIRADADAGTIATHYLRGGAAAISVLTDGPFFGGSLSDLQAVRAAVPLPVLRKDFIIDPYQIEESRAFGADAVLVIVAATEARQRRELLSAAAAIDLDVIVEVHDEAELASAIEAGAVIVGVNNRDLRTFRTTLAVSERLLPLVPPSVLAICESGLGSATDIEHLARLGARAFLIGETLIESPHPEQRLRELLGG
jgi:indole-3-glycerol phosphate synthase